MARQVEQQVNAVGVDALGQLRVVERGGFDPVLHALLRQAGLVVVAHACEIQKHLKTLAIELAQHWLHEDVHRMLVMKIRAHHAEFDAPPIQRWPHKTLARTGTLPQRRKQLAVQIGDLFCRQLVAVERGHGRAGGKLALLACFSGQFAVQAQGRVRVALPPGNGGSHALGTRHGSQLLGFLQHLLGLVHLPAFGHQVGQIPTRRGALWVQLNALAQHSQGLLPQVVPKSHGPQTGQSGFVGRDRCLREHLQGCAVLTPSKQGLAQIHQHFGLAIHITRPRQSLTGLQSQPQHLVCRVVVTQLQQVLAHAVCHLGRQCDRAFALGLDSGQCHGLLKCLTSQWLLLELVQHPRHGQRRFVAHGVGVDSVLVGPCGLLQLAHLAAQMTGLQPSTVVRGL
ncbi:MAG: hypothetical protein CFE38_11500 [Comamonadaceae bacterium PBBC1]|nr:MAG: hypothetical protein CFE38_11500 [Comamonadaceae bacterium PBBC1]